MRCPDHLKGFVTPIGCFASILPVPTNEYFVAYQVKCICKNNYFSVKKNNRPLVVASCNKCNQEIVLYDTDQYPDAISYDNEGELIPVISPKNNDIYTICVAFEYPEVIDGDDEEYSDNDISWCYIYGCPDGKAKDVFTIIDDETM